MAPFVPRTAGMWLCTHCARWVFPSRTSCAYCDQPRAEGAQVSSLPNPQPPQPIPIPQPRQQAPLNPPQPIPIPQPSGSRGPLVLAAPAFQFPNNPRKFEKQVSSTPIHNPEIICPNCRTSNYSTRPGCRLCLRKLPK